MPTPASRPAKIPTPPKSGVSWRCQRSAEGAATTRLAIGARRSNPIVSRLAGRATSAATAVTARRASAAQFVRVVARGPA